MDAWREKDSIAVSEPPYGAQTGVLRVHLNQDGLGPRPAETGFEARSLRSRTLQPSPKGSPHVSPRAGALAATVPGPRASLSMSASAQQSQAHGLVPRKGKGLPKVT